MPSGCHSVSRLPHRAELRTPPGWREEQSSVSAGHRGSLQRAPVDASAPSDEPSAPPPGTTVAVRVSLIRRGGMWTPPTSPALALRARDLRRSRTVLRPLPRVRGGRGRRPGQQAQAAAVGLAPHHLHRVGSDASARVTFSPSARALVRPIASPARRSREGTRPFPPHSLIPLRSRLCRDVPRRALTSALPVPFGDDKRPGHHCTSSLTRKRSLVRSQYRPPHLCRSAACVPHGNASSLI